MKRYITKVILFIGALILLLVVVGMILSYNKDGYIRAQKFKMDALANPSRKPTIVILGGSNAAFRYYTKELNDSLPVPVFNAGLHAGMGMNFFWMIVLNILRKVTSWCLVLNMINFMEI